MLSQSNLGIYIVIFGCMVSRFCQPIDSLFTFSTVQFLSYCASLALSTATVLVASLLATL